MAGKPQFEQRVYDAILKHYAAGMKLVDIESACGVARNTVYRVVKMHCATLRQSRSTPPATSAPKVPFDRFSAIPETPCKCGKGCGLTFRRTIGQRGRIYAVGCPNAPDPRGQRQENRKRVHRAPRNGRPSAAAERTPIKRCKVCCDLPHARAYPVCTEAWVVWGGKKQLEQGCGRPYQASDSLPDHDHLKRCGVAPLASEE